MTTEGVAVVPIDKKTAEQFIVAQHYSHRAPIFWAGFGLVVDGMIDGVVVYGQPSAPIQKHAFSDRSFRLYELARLVVQTEMRNAASILVGRSLKRLEQPSAVVSYADTEWGHAGVIYQATNWLYTGATKSHDHAYLVDGKRTHPMTLRDRGITDPKRWAKENGIATVPPMEKHRYFFLNGTKAQRKAMLAALRYPVVAEYPKLPKRMYDSGPIIDVAYEDAAA
jgi:hypothetical protein